MMRSVPEWIGKTDDTRVPDQVRLRVWDRYQGRCQCGGCDYREIGIGEKWQVDHKHALINGGANRETNLVPILVDHHKVKTAADVAEKSKVYRIRARHLGIRPPRKMTRWRRFNKDPVFAPRER